MFIGWIVSASGVADIPGVCGGLWDNLQGRCVPNNAYCGGVNGDLVWSFNTIICVPGNVEGAWWEATHNNYGSIDCENF